MWKLSNEITESKTKVWGRYLFKKQKILKKKNKSVSRDISTRRLCPKWLNCNGIYNRGQHTLLVTSQLSWILALYTHQRRRQWHPTPVLLPGKSHGWRSLEGCSPWGRGESDTTERLHFHFSPSCIGEGNGNPLQCSCLENPRDQGSCWAAVYGVAQSQTWLKWLHFTYTHQTVSTAEHWCLNVKTIIVCRWIGVAVHQ